MRLSHCAVAMCRRLALVSVSASAVAAATPAMADCTADASGLDVTCSGTSAAYSNTASGVTATADNTAVVTGPLVFGSNAKLGNAGTISGSLTVPVVQMGDNATVTNTGTITASGGIGSTAAVAVGANSSITNSGTLGASAGTPAATLGAQSTFTNNSTVAAVTGDIVFAATGGAATSAFANAASSVGVTGNVTATGNLTLDNAAPWTGNLGQTGNGGTVAFTNEATGTFSGLIASQDATTIDNLGVMTLNDTTTVAGNGTATVTNGLTMNLNGQVTFGAASSGSSLANNGTLTIGSATAPGKVTVNGGFSQGSAGVLALGIASPTKYSQLIATGNAALAGTIQLNVAPGYYAQGSVFKVISAGSITGSAAVAGNTFAFFSFQPVGVVADGTGQAYEFVVQRTAPTYAAALAGVGSATELATAGGLQGLTPAAVADPASNAGVLLGQVDVLSVPQALAFLDALNPAGYLAYAGALRDQANMFSRAVAMRMGDQNSEHDESGWWGSGEGQFHFGGGNTLYGFNLGYDVSGPHHVLGLAGSVSWDSLSGNGGALQGKNRAWTLAAYGGWRLGNVHLTGQVGYVFGHLGATRTMALGTVTDTATAAGSEHLLKATATAGYELKAMGYSLEPFVGIDFARGQVDGFAETGANAADLTVNPISARRTDLLVGANLARAEGQWRPYLRAAWRSALGSAGADSVTAYLNGDPTTAFTVSGVGLARHEFDVDAGMNIVFDDAGSLFVGYQGTMRQGLSMHGINAGIRIEF